MLGRFTRLQLIAVVANYARPGMGGCGMLGHPQPIAGGVVSYSRPGKGGSMLGCLQLIAGGFMNYMRLGTGTGMLGRNRSPVALRTMQARGQRGIACL